MSGDVLHVRGVARPIALKRSKQAKRFTLRISHATGDIRLTVPPRASKREAQRFAEAQREWLLSHQDAAPEAAPFRDGAEIPFRGAPFRIATTTGRTITARGGVLSVPADHLALRLEHWLKTQARESLKAACDHYAARIETPYERITLRDTKSRWGSCSTRGNLSFSWRLIMAPPEVLDYVAAHEVAHLIEMNHSPDFWALCAELRPDYALWRDWLRENGADLHRYGREI